MNDVVKCTGYVGDTPMLEFVRKGGDVSNLHGEKLPASALMVAINEALGILGMNCKAVQVFPDASVPRYNIYLEANKINKDLEKVLEESLKNHHWSYNKFRDKKILMPLSVTFMKKGWQQELYNQKKANSKVNEAQIKLPLFIHKRPLDIWYES